MHFSLSDLGQISHEDETRQLKEWNKPTGEYPSHIAIPEWLHQCIKNYANQPIIHTSERTYSYLEIDKKSDLLAFELQKLAFLAQSKLIVYLPLGVDFIVSILGILKAGHVCVPLIANWNMQSMLQIFNNSGAKLILTKQEILSSPNELSLEDKMLYVELVEESQIRVLSDKRSPTEIAFVIYPEVHAKSVTGIIWNHQNVIGSVHAKHQIFQEVERHAFSEHLGIGQVILTLMQAFSTGSCLVFYESEVADIVAFGKITDRNQVSMLALHAPLYRRLLLSSTHYSLSRLTKVIILEGGLDKSLLELHEKMCPTANLYNDYSAPETTYTGAFALAYSSTAKKSEDISMGRPLANTNIFILNDNNKLVPIGSVGEMLIGGVGVSEGYLNNLDVPLFIENPYNKKQKLFKTSVMVKYLHDGRIEYVGKKQNQVEVFKNNVYLEKIEKTLRNHKSVADCIVLPFHENKNRLIAHIELRKEFKNRADNLEQILTKYLSSILPTYMIPRYWNFIDHFDYDYVGNINANALNVHKEKIKTHDLEVIPKYELDMKQVLCEVLQIGNIDLNDNFFEVGGDSILCIQLVSKMRKLGLEINMEQIFDAPTMQAICDLGKPSPSIAVDKGTIIKKILCDILKRESIDVKDNFFSMGGDSILCMQFVFKARKADIDLNIEQVFDAPNIQAIIDNISEISSIEKQFKKETQQTEEIFSLSPIQKWFFEHQHPNFNHYNQAVFLETQTPLNPDVLEEAIQDLINIHSSLRLRFKQDNKGDWQQYYQPYEREKKIGQNTLQIINVHALPEHAIKEKYNFAINNAQKALNIEKGPTLKVILFTETNSSKLFIVIHHLAVDTVSWSILLETLKTCYQTRLKKIPNNLERKIDQNGYGNWINQLSQQSVLNKFEIEIPFWQALLLKAKSLTTRKYDYILEENTVEKATSVSGTLTIAETDRLLKEMPKIYHTQINDILLCALCYAYQEWAGEEGLVVDLEAHGRDYIFDSSIDLTTTVGWFTTIYPVYLTVNREDLIENNISIVKETLRSIPNKGVGFGVLRYLANSFSKEPIMIPVGFNYLGQTDKALQLEGLFQFSEDSIGSATDLRNRRSHELEITSEVVYGQYQIYIEFSQNHYRKETVELLLQYYKKWLSTIIAYGSKKKSNFYVPSDFPMANLSQEQIDSQFRPLGEIENIYPLSPMQESLLFQNLSQPDSKSYFIQTAFDVKGKINIEKFQKAWHIVVQHFSILRTGFKWSGLDQPLQFILKNVSIQIKYENWHAEIEPRKKLLRFLEWLEAQTFHFDKPPLVNVYLMGVTPTHCYMVWNFHHIILDGWCTAIIINKLLEVYQNLLDSKVIIISQELRSYQEYISWIREQDSKCAELFWSDYLRNCNCTKLELANYDVNISEKPHCVIEKFFDTLLSQNIIQFAKSQKVLLSNIYQLAWGIVLSRYTNLDDVIFGVTVSGRTIDLKGVEDMLGLFINTIPKRFQFKQSSSILELLKEMQREVTKTQRYAYLPLSKIQSLGSTHGHGSLFNTLFIFEGGTFKRQFSEYELIIEGIATEEKIEYPLSVIVQSNDAGVSVSFFYDQNKFKEIQIEQIARHYQNTLISLLNKENSYIKDIQVISEKEKQEILACWQGVEEPFVLNKSIIDVFKNSVVLYSQNCAVKDKEQSLSYETLDDNSKKIADFLLNLKLDQNAKICLWCHRSVTFLASLLGIWKAGLCYVPIDPKTPILKIQKILKQLEDVIILSTRAYGNSINQLVKENVYFIEDILSAEEIVPYPDIKLDINQYLDSIAYIIFTSGSTGEPKGVMVPHRAMLNHLHSKISTMNLSQEDVISQTSSQTFDVSVWQLISPLMIGGTVSIIDDETLVQPELFASRIQKDNISVLSTVPSLLSIFLERLEENIDVCDTLKCINWLILIGEAFTSDLYYRWCQIFPQTRVINAYGPTECGDAVTHYHTSNEIQYSRALPIHGTIPNMRLYILNEQLEMTPLGVVGELCVSGQGLAKGYYGLSEQTSNVFVNNPFKFGEKLYKTGDLVVGLQDGQIYFVGRKDKQVKINGIRIELLEIESLLKAYRKISDVKLNLHKSDNGTELIAYYISSNGETIEKNELEFFLKDRLAQNMHPKYYIRMQSFPLTSSGKIDYRKLPLPETVLTEVDTKKIAASTALEAELQKLWGKILGSNDISVAESFTNAGGHSLLAIRLMLRIKSTFKVDIPITAILNDLTISSLAKMIENNQASKFSALTTIQTSIADLNLFFIHPITGLSNVYQKLPTYIKSYGLYGISNPYFGVSESNFTTIEEMASNYIEIISQIQKNGPYHLVGWSFGGLVALEMAVQLSNKSEAVANVFLVDTYHPKTFQSHDLEEEINTLLIAENTSLDSIEGKQLYHSIKIHDALMRQYVPKVYKGRVTLLQATAGQFIPKGGWQQHEISNLKVVSIPALHYEIFKEPAVKIVSKSIVDNIKG